jgi:hypothetical protein
MVVADQVTILATNGNFLSFYRNDSPKLTTPLFVAISAPTWLVHLLTIYYVVRTIYWLLVNLRIVIVLQIGRIRYFGVRCRATEAVRYGAIFNWTATH